MIRVIAALAMILASTVSFADASKPAPAPVPAIAPSPKTATQIDRADWNVKLLADSERDNAKLVLEKRELQVIQVGNDIARKYAIGDADSVKVDPSTGVVVITRAAVPVSESKPKKVAKK